jgi:hypothetical protein
MNNKFDELTKSMAQSVTRRAALKKFGVGLAGIALACFGLPRRAKAQTTQKGKCVVMPNFAGGNHALVYTGGCVDPNTCQGGPSSNCPAGGKAQGSLSACGTFLGNKACSF